MLAKVKSLGLTGIEGFGVVVEAELGAIAGIEDEVQVDDKYGCFTHPDEAVDFVSRTLMVEAFS